MVDLGSYLRKLRRDKKLTLSEVKNQTGCSVAYLSMIEQGHRAPPRPDVLRKLAKAYGASVEEIMRVAGYLPEKQETGIFSPEEEIEWAIAAILRDPGFGSFIDKARVKYMPLDMKIRLIKAYEAMTGRRFLRRKK